MARAAVGTGVRPSLRILVVDDNEVLRTLVSQVLEAEGYVAIPAESAEAALEVIRFAPPDLCIVDQVMPGMSGAELIRVLRNAHDERLRSIPTIGMSAYEGAQGELLAAGALAALKKPLRYAPLLDLIRDTLIGNGEEEPSAGADSSAL
jgi:CheY-like chemotaxis protein